MRQKSYSLNKHTMHMRSTKYTKNKRKVKIERNGNFK